MGSGDKDGGREMVDEVARIAQTIDPSISHAELSSGPLGRGIGRRNELRDNLAGRPPRRIVEGRQISFTARLDLAGVVDP